jgi:hypothetical protein
MPAVNPAHRTPPAQSRELALAAVCMRHITVSFSACFLCSRAILFSLSFIFILWNGSKIIYKILTSGPTR